MLTLRVSAETESYHQLQLNKYMTRVSLLHIIFHGCIGTEKNNFAQRKCNSKNAHATSSFVFQIPVYLHNYITTI